MQFNNTDEHNNANILIVDDDNISRITIKKVLEKSGYTVATAESGAQAIEICIDQLPDLILLDVIMPGLNGYETCAALRNIADYNLLPILMLTGLDDMESIDKAFRSGGTDFITKPLNWPLLTQRVRYALRTRDLFNELNASKLKLTKAQNIAKIGYWEFDPDNEILTLSTEAVSLLGQTKNKFTLDEFLHSVSPIEALQIRSEIKQVLSTGISYSLDHSFTSEQGLELTLNHHAEVSTLNNEKIIIGTFQDISERIEAEEQIYFHKYYDPDTSLPNKEYLAHQLDKITENDSNESLTGVLFLSFDKLRSIGSTIGSSFVNMFLTTSANRIQKSIPEIKEITRTGGTTLGFIIPNIYSSEQLEAICTLLIQLFRQPLNIENAEYHTTLSIGATIYPYDDNIHDLLNNAATAHKRCISEGGSQYLFYRKDMDDRANELIILEDKMRKALLNKEFSAFFQPQINTENFTITGMEALARWIEPDGTMIFPDTFIPLAEETEIIIDLGREILMQACRFSHYLKENNFGQIRTGVNLSALQFSDDMLIPNIKSALEETGLSPSLLEIEITESIAMTDINHAVKTLTTIRDMGIKTSMDDFGTGYSSLSYLQKLPLDTLKIDQSFIRPIQANGKNSEIAKAIIAMGHSLNMHLIAEGAEEEYHYQFLKDQGCHEVQGYYFSKPISTANFEEFSRDFNHKK